MHLARLLQASFTVERSRNSATTSVLLAIRTARVPIASTIFLASNRFITDKLRVVKRKSGLCATQPCQPHVTLIAFRSILGDRSELLFERNVCVPRGDEDEFVTLKVQRIPVPSIWNLEFQFLSVDVCVVVSISEFPQPSWNDYIYGGIRLLSVNLLAVHLPSFSSLKRSSGSVICLTFSFRVAIPHTLLLSFFGLF